MSARHYLFVIAAAALVTLLMTPLVRAWSVRRGLVDEPGGRKVHTHAISRLGGIAMFAGFIAAVVVEALGERQFGWGGALLPPSPGVWGVLAGMVVIFAVGVIDDIYTLTPGPKLLGQIVAAGIVIGAGLRIDFIGNPFGGGLIALGLLGIPVTLVYIVGFTNVINLIDGLDGLAAGVSAIAATSFLVLAAQSNRLEAAALAAALIGACLGFLRYNFNPASIFMGDSGAMFLGFALSSISLLGVMKSVAAITLVVPLLIIGVPIFDTASAIVRRIRHNRPIQEADKGHIHHRLLGRGFDQRQTVLIIYVWSAVLAVGGYAMRYAPSLIKIATFAVLAVLSGLMAYWLGLFEAASHHGGDSDTD
ncbi:MAG: undecaprenyl/decaprenyl-phosphate alpha-N-acetylglucosaminyl 1-phosphate transferase [Actinobacteria bacterium]|nr:undecaprenyl/decaprenyl-phosphate alpha-N-acetylglucosaminyl 1-phosphate transferase [Actinomycetota bacterium]MCG2806899.1 undecaprenyl/decaprenyl-phosphate alpha-N-acetylglucosaminyl 1-phosphate transferase [Coriobacteriia bacterium]